MPDPPMAVPPAARAVLSDFPSDSGAYRSVTMSDDNTPIDGSKSGHVDEYPNKSVNDMKALIEANNAAMQASGDETIVIQTEMFKQGRGPKPKMDAVAWWGLRYKNSSYHVSMHLKQDKLHEARTN